MDRDFLKRLEHLRLRLKRLGRRRGEGAGGEVPERGGRAEFHGHRAYAPGDDLRAVDWAAYARTERLYVKEFTREKGRDNSILLDASRSMESGDPSKWEYGCRVAAALAYLGLADGERVRVALCGDGSPVATPWLEGEKRFAEAAEFLSRASPAGGDRPIWGLSDDGGARNARRTAAVTDLLFDATHREGLFRALAAGEGGVFQVLAREEAEPDLLAGEWEFVDAETGRTRRMAVGEIASDAYRRELERFSREGDLHARRHGLFLGRSVTVRPFEDFLFEELSRARWYI
ncbi:MAG: DUF58 domain-containing protein [Planctomycetota bacterium]